VEHRERAQLAGDVLLKLVEVYPGEILLAGVIGSTARGEDTEWSDLDLFVVTTPDSSYHEQTHIVRGIALVINVLNRAELEQALQNPDLQWPYLMGVLSGLRVLHGDAALVQGWLAIGKNLPRRRLHLALSRHLPELVFESYGRVLSCGRRRDEFTVLHAAIEVLYEMKTALCLLNGRWVTRDYYQGFEDVFSFEYLPRDYAQLVPALWQERDLDRIITLAGTLVNNYWQLLTGMGLNIVNHQAVASIPLRKAG
jgi:kanamycin nucleotidyltransferase